MGGRSDGSCPSGRLPQPDSALGARRPRPDRDAVGNGEIDRMVTGELELVPLPELFARYGAILRELRRRDIVRTNDAPAGGWAEYLVCRCLAGTPAPNSEKSWDVLTPDHGRIQVKARVVFDRSNRSQRQLSSLRSFSFDMLAVVLFDDLHAVWRAVLLPVGEVQKHARPDRHVNGHRLLATDALLNVVAASDITEDLRRVATGSR
jgi:hypothetical protein